MSLLKHQQEKDSLSQDHRLPSIWTAMLSKFTDYRFIYSTPTYIFLIPRRGSFPLLRDGELIPVSVQFNKLTKFAKLQVGKQIATAKQKQGSKNPLFPQTIAVAGLAPLLKVWADYLPPPKNKFDIKVNGDDYYKLKKEDIDLDPSKVELFECN